MPGPWIAWIATTGGSTARLIVVLPVRAWASAIVTASVFGPAGVPSGTVAWNVNTRSPAMTSPLVPSSKKGCAAAPPIEASPAVTARPVLVGDWPGVTSTARVTGAPAGVEAGVAVPTPEGLVGPAQAFSGEALLRGVGGPAVKSDPLLSVSVQPFPIRRTAVAFVVAGAGVPSKKLAPSHPTRSTSSASCAAEQGVEPPLHPRGVVVLTTATLPPVPLMLIGVASVTSGAGRLTVPPEPWASWMRRYWPGARVTAGSSVRRVAPDPKFPVPAALVYWTDQPARLTGEPPRLNSSMKSFRYVAPLFPPPP